MALTFLSFSQPVVTHDFFRITQTTSRSTSTPGAWRYVIAPRTKEARRYWGVLVADWVRTLRLGLPVRFGPYELVVKEKHLTFEPSCARFRPRCYTRPALPAGYEYWKLDLILVDFHNAFTWTLEDAQKRAKPYPATIAVSKFVRFYLNPDGPFKVDPLGWKP